MSTAAVIRQPTPHSPLRRMVARHPVAAFLVMVYALGWFTLIAGDCLGLPMLLSSSLGVAFGLALPAFLVTAATDGKAKFWDLLGQLDQSNMRIWVGT